MARVVTVDAGEEPVAYPYEVLRESPTVNGLVDGEPVAVLWQRGTASALDEGSIDAGRDVGSAGAFSRRLDRRTLTFRSEGGAILDKETGSEWNVVGEAVAGEPEGRRLELAVSIDHFWFSWPPSFPRRESTTPRTRGERMRRLTTLIALLITTLSIVACGASEPQRSGQADPSEETQAAPATQGAPTEETAPEDGAPSEVAPQEGGEAVGPSVTTLEGEQVAVGDQRGATALYFMAGW